MKAKTMQRLTELEARILNTKKVRPLEIRCIYEDGQGRIIKGADLLDRPGPALYIYIVKTIEPGPAAAGGSARPGSSSGQDEARLIAEIERLEARKKQLQGSKP